MSNTINLVLPFNDKNVELVKVLLAKAELNRKVNDIDVVGAEEVGDTKAAKEPAKRASRAKPKAEPVEEEDPEFEIDPEEEENEEGVTVDDIKELQAKKVTAHRVAIIAKLKKLNCKGISTLDPDNYQEYYDFLGKLK